MPKDQPPTVTSLLTDALDDMAFLAGEHSGFKAMRNVASARREAIMSLKRLVTRLEMGDKMPRVERVEFHGSADPVVNYEIQQG